MAPKKTLTDLKTITKKILSYLDPNVKIEILENEDQININLDTENPGILIGYHGETLSALQLLVSLIYYKQTGTWQDILLNIGNYREVRKEQINQLLQRVIERVVETQSSQPLPYLSSAERKIAHLLLEDHPVVYSESEGEGQYRRLYIKLKPKTLTNP